ncbi:MAG: cytochrome b/b6 domain-containing protein [Ignavibacteriales bacterium]|jgi:Thiosulfate reductase cytochrome B subunit (membrane anchoring protein)|nr:MAG: cytochrome B [Ignavibacteriaceae bacterium]MBW7874143.1 cytochrome b/b6 domain-containing protein [Ignavibacteria bacterium]MCZ2142918.1 cytochrome b/b6 domain-containing protein [Ignavibacteriales bacterium]OQY78309.1 MAG: cytochrome b [Ignavibacteriales bacterium UTCHB3]MBV6444528.1 Thiosulfate reductase cytochrome B subunit PhsC [Ignavibacteriaceae bacterium]
MKKQVYIYKSFERFWHWTQAFLIFFLGFTGFEIHGSFTFFGYQNAVEYHNIAAYAFIILIAFAIFWHFSTGEWKQYVPTLTNIKAQINFYLIGIFRDAPHPTKKTVLSKLNPLQRLVYAGLKLLVIPVMVISGLLYMFYRYPQAGGVVGLDINSVEPIALFHTAGAFALVAFVIVHLYLITTGHKPTTNLKAMITGYEDLEEEESEKGSEIKEVAGAEAAADISETETPALPAKNLD